MPQKYRFIESSNKTITDERDWQVWKYKIKCILNCHNGALEVVEGKLVKPESLAVEADDAAWIKYYSGFSES